MDEVDYLRNKGVTREVISYMLKNHTNINNLYDWLIDKYDYWDDKYRSLFLNNRIWAYKALNFDIDESILQNIRRNRYTR